MRMSVIQKAAQLGQEQRPFVYVVILRSIGSTSRSDGSMVVEAGGRITGTVGGGDVELYAQRQSLGLLATNQKGRHLRYEVQEGQGEVDLYLMLCNNTEEWAAFATLRRWEEQAHFCTIGVQIQPHPAILGLSEGGGVTGPVHPQFLQYAAATLTSKLPNLVSEGAYSCHYSLPVKAYTLLLVGGGHVNQAIATLAATVGLPIQVVETRPAYATAPLFPQAKRIVVRESIEETLNEVHVDDYTFAIVASHAFDQVAAKILLDRSVAYLGVLGSRHKAKSLENSLKLSKEQRQRLYCPIGLDIGAQTPQEIAVSVIAEILSLIGSRRGGHMRDSSRRLVVVRGASSLALEVATYLTTNGWQTMIIAEETVQQTHLPIVVATDVRHAFGVVSSQQTALLFDPTGEVLDQLDPLCIVDATEGKSERPSAKEDAPLVVGLGPSCSLESGCDHQVAIEGTLAGTVHSAKPAGQTQSIDEAVLALMENFIRTYRQ
jgi:xanthine dehydrogenase accessory factor